MQGMVTNSPSENVDATSPKSRRGAVRFGVVEVASAAVQQKSYQDAETTSDIGMAGDAIEADNPSRRVVFEEVCDGPDSSGNLPGSSKPEKRKSQFSRFLKGEALAGGGVTSPKKAARKTLANLQSKRKSMGPQRSPRGQRGLVTRKTLGTVGLAKNCELNLNGGIEPILNHDASERDGRRGIPSEIDTSRGLSRVVSTKLSNRSRSLSRGPRRGRDRFRGMGASFSTSKARDAPRRPRTAGGEEVPEGSSSRVVMSVIRSKRKVSPSPSRASASKGERKRRSDLLKCRSADVENVRSTWHGSDSDV